MSRVAAALTLLALSTLSCQPPKPVVIPETVPPRTDIRAEPIPIGGKLHVDLARLPARATGKFSSYDGDNFTVHIPPGVAGAVPAKEVFDNTVVPLLTAMGYGDRVSEIALPEGKSDGDPLPRANLARLAAETCKEVQNERYKRFHPVCEAMIRGQADPVAERVFGLAYGMTFAQFKADAERQRIQYVFTQRPGGVTIEHTGVIAARWEGATITSIVGTIFNRYVIVNHRELTPDAAIAAAQAKVLTLKGVDSSATGLPSDHGPVLELLPYGGADDHGDRVPGLRYAWRTLLFARQAVGRPLDRPPSRRQPGNLLSWMAWIDAQDGKLLQLLPQYAEEFATVPRWRRDPSTPVQTANMEIDGPAGGQVTLQRAGVFNRFDRLGDGDFNDDEVSVANAGGAINFNVPPLNDAAASQCGGANNAFRQLNAYAHLNSVRDTMVNAGTFPSLPESAITVWLDSDDNSTLYDGIGVGQSRIKYALGSAFNQPGCPDVADANLPGTEDPTTMVHEFTHVSTPRMSERRPADWCGMANCPMPFGRLLFHDFADGAAQAYASIPCQAGWSRKNQGGVNASLNCATHTEALEVKPRLSSVDEPFDPATPKDHFPERRTTPALLDPYSDMQITSTAFWLTRQGMRSKCLPSGTPQYWIRWNRALYNFGFIPTTCVVCMGTGDNAFCNNSCDRDVYRYAQNFLAMMAEQWATSGEPGGPPGFAHNGRHSTNKLLSGWARVGIFLTPVQCIDGDLSTSNPTFCPNGEMGGDAIVDVRDNDAADDNVIDGVTHPELDYIKRGSISPTFRVWTGPRFKFDANGTASNFTPSAATPSPCHTEYRVELSNDETFASGVVTSGWRSASATAQPQCYGTWTPSAAVWSPFEGSSGDVKVYYRVRTHDATSANERISTQPGSGSYDIPPAYLVVNNAGQP